MADPHDDSALIADVAERLAGELDVPDPQPVHSTVREELEYLRRTARVQTFVTILTERHARSRLVRERAARRS